MRLKAIYIAWLIIKEFMKRSVRQTGVNETVYLLPKWHQFLKIMESLRTLATTEAAMALAKGLHEFVSVLLPSAKSETPLMIIHGTLTSCDAANSPEKNKAFCKWILEKKLVEELV